MTDEYYSKVPGDAKLRHTLLSMLALVSPFLGVRLLALWVAKQTASGEALVCSDFLSTDFIMALAGILAFPIARLYIWWDVRAYVRQART